MRYFELYSLEHAAILDDFPTKREGEQALVAIANEHGFASLRALSWAEVNDEVRTVIAAGDDLVRFVESCSTQIARNRKSA